MENLNNLFIECPFIQQVWFISKWNYRVEVYIDVPIKNWLALIFDKRTTCSFSQIIRDEFIVYIAAFFDFV